MTVTSLASAARSLICARQVFRDAVQRFLGIRGNSAALARELQISKAYVSEMRHGGSISDGVVEKLARMK